MHSQFPLSFHVPNDNLIQRKSLATQNFCRVGGSNQATDLWASIDFFDYSLTIFPELDFPVSGTATGDEDIGNYPI